MSAPKTLSINIINQLNAPPQTTPLQKALILIGLGTFLALVALTASLPLPLRKHQSSSLPTEGDDGFVINVGDTAWLIVATAFAILSSPALSYLYANLYGSSEFSVQVSLIVGAVIAVIWIVVSFSLTYAKDANGDEILGFPKYYYMFAHVGSSPDYVYTDTIPFSIFAIFELSYPILAAAIVVSAIIDRVNVYGLVTFLFIWHLTIYTPIAHVTWNTRGFFHTNYIEDFSGGLVVHMTAGITAAAAHLFLDWIQAPKAERRAPTSPEQLIGAATVLWFLWFGLNAGKAYHANSVATQSVVNTIAGVATSVLTNYFLDALLGYPYSDVSVTNAILIGLISTSPSTGFVTVGGAMTITVITVLTVRVLGRYILKENLENTPYSIATLHGIGGSTAFLFTALLSYAFVNPADFNGLTFGIATPIRHHTAAVLALWSCGFLAILLALVISNLIVPLSKSKQNPKGEFSPVPLGFLSGSDNSQPPAQDVQTA